MSYWKFWIRFESKVLGENSNHQIEVGSIKYSFAIDAKRGVPKEEKSEEDELRKNVINLQVFLIQRRSVCGKSFFFKIFNTR